MDTTILMAAGIIVGVLGTTLAVFIASRRRSAKRRRQSDEAKEKILAARRLEKKLAALELGSAEDHKDYGDQVIQARLLPDFEAEIYEWLFKNDNLRDYYKGELLADTGAFKRVNVFKPAQAMWNVEDSE